VALLFLDRGARPLPRVELLQSATVIIWELLMADKATFPLHAAYATTFNGCQGLALQHNDLEFPWNFTHLLPPMLLGKTQPPQHLSPSRQPIRCFLPSLPSLRSLRGLRPRSLGALRRCSGLFRAMARCNELSFTRESAHTFGPRRWISYVTLWTHEVIEVKFS
jgi:hypothetical protein